MTQHIRVAIGFKHFTGADVDELAGNVIVGTTGYTTSLIRSATCAPKLSQDHAFQLKRHFM
jgi:hypothetical protein